MKNPDIDIEGIMEAILATAILIGLLALIATTTFLGYRVITNWKCGGEQSIIIGIK